MMKRRKCSIIALLCLSMISVIAACERQKNLITSPDQSDFVLGDTLGIAYQDTIFSRDEDIWITFDFLVHDSRCPTNVVCFWEGNAEMSLAFFNNRVTEFSLNTFLGFTTDTTVLDHRISLVNVQPVPHTDSLYTEKDYFIQIVVTQEK